jgi:hypothetical protein
MAAGARASRDRYGREALNSRCHKAAADEREQALSKRALDLADREGRLRVGEEIVARWKAQHDHQDPDLQPASTLRRERARAS